MSDSADDIVIKWGRSDLISADETVITLRTGTFSYTNWRNKQRID